MFLIKIIIKKGKKIIYKENFKNKPKTRYWS